MLYLIGLGLGDERDITLKGMDAISKCTDIYLESYTSILPGLNIKKLENLYKKSVLIADREFVEEGKIVDLASDKNVALLVIGDVFGATTHTDLVIRAREQNIQVSVVHNTSILNAIGCTGLMLYNFGSVVSVPFFKDNWKPASWYDKVQENRKRGLHTLLLLDIKVKEQSDENMARGRLIYEAPRFMTVNQALEQYIEVATLEGIPEVVVGCARIGATDQIIKSGSIEEVIAFDFGAPLHSVIIPGDLHFLEKEALDAFTQNKSRAENEEYVK